MNDNEIRYKGYLIREYSYELKTGGWVPQAIVFDPASRGMAEHPPLSPTEEVTFPTRQLARQYAVDMAKRFVNRQLRKEG